MLGMIKYCAVPYFHKLVTNKDYKMICIFEVFAQNRNEDDFLENLGFYSNQRHDENEISSPEQAQQANENQNNMIIGVAHENDQREMNKNVVQDEQQQPTDPNLVALSEIKTSLEIS